DAHRLVVLVDLAAQPVTGERQHDQGGDSDEVPDIAHPVVVGALLIALGGEEAVAGVRADDGAAEYHVGDEPVDVDGHPRGVGDGVPQLDGRGVGGGGDVARRGHH